MLVEIKRFYRRAKVTIAEGDDSLTLREFLVAAEILQLFRPPLHGSGGLVAYGLPAPAAALEYPARYLFMFPRQSRHAVGRRITAMADDHGRLPDLRRTTRQRAACGAHGDPRPLGLHAGRVTSRSTTTVTRSRHSTAS